MSSRINLTSNITFTPVSDAKPVFFAYKTCIVLFYLHVGSSASCFTSPRYSWRVCAYAPKNRFHVFSSSHSVSYRALSPWSSSRFEITTGFLTGSVAAELDRRNKNRCCCPAKKSRFILVISLAKYSFISFLPNAILWFLQHCNLLTLL